MPFLVLAILVVLVALVIIATAYFVVRRWW
jgi:Flp pilus assembly pilin Flp